MALMFRSVLQNAGGAAELIVTCDSEFAGATISCSDGTTTLNKTCPVSSPYEVTFKIPNSGDWTISATVSGTTYSSDPISVDLDYSTVLEYGFSWKRWVDTAQYLDSTDYSTLSDLLADEEAVRELCLEHACVDYLCNGATVTADLATVINNDLFAKWVNNSDYALDFLHANEIIADYMDEADKYGYGEWVIIDDTTTPPTWGAKGNVPIMTSNSAPYGAVSVSNYYSSYYGYCAFDGNPSTLWSTNNGASSNYIQYKSTNPICVRMLSLLTAHTQRASTFTLKGSNDDFASDSHDIVVINSSEITDNVPFSKMFENDNYYLYHRLVINYAENNGVSIIEFQFYGRELSVSVPSMATNTTPYGEVIMDSEATNNPAYKAFDGTIWASNTDRWVPATKTTGDFYLGYKFTHPVICTKMCIAFPSSSELATYYVNQPTQYQIQGHDGTNWHDLKTITRTVTSNGATEVVDFENDTPYIAYRAYMTQINYNTYRNVNVKYMQFFGKDYSEKEFEVGTTRKWLYDHGLELVEMDGNYGSTASTNLPATKESAQIYYPNSGSSDTLYAYGVSNQIDLTNYNLIRFKDGNKGVIGSRYALLLVMAMKTFNTTISGNTQYASLAVTSMGYPKGLDISSVNVSAYLAISSGYNCSYSFEELWLE